MNDRYFRLAAVLALLIVLLVGWLAVVSPQRQDASNLSTQIIGAQRQAATLAAQTAAGKATRRNVRRAKRDLRELRKALPDSYAEPALIDTFQHEAQRAHVDFQGLTFTAPTSTSTATSTSAAGSTTTTAATTTGATTTATTPAATGATASADLTQLGFTLTLAGRYFNVTRFIAALQNMTGTNGRKLWVTGRLIAVTGVSVTATTSRAGTVLATLSGNAYLLPRDDDPALAAETGAGR